MFQFCLFNDNCSQSTLKGFKVVWDMGDQKMKPYFIIPFSKNSMSKQDFNYDPFN